MPSDPRISVRFTDGRFPADPAAEVRNASPRVDPNAPVREEPTIAPDRFVSVLNLVRGQRFYHRVNSHADPVLVEYREREDGTFTTRVKVIVRSENPYWRLNSTIDLVHLFGESVELARPESSFELDADLEAPEAPEGAFELGQSRAAWQAGWRVGWLAGRNSR